MRKITEALRLLHECSRSHREIAVLHPSYGMIIVLNEQWNNISSTMSRPIHIEFPDALYHVTARGDRREDIFEDAQDRLEFLLILEQPA